MPGELLIIVAATLRLRSKTRGELVPPGRKEGGEWSLRMTRVRLRIYKYIYVHECVRVYREGK